MKADTNMDGTTKLRAVVAALVDQALARRIDEVAERLDLSSFARIQWIAEAIARRDDLIAEVTAKAGRLADEPAAPTVDLQ